MSIRFWAPVMALAALNVLITDPGEFRVAGEYSASLEEDGDSAVGGEAEYLVSTPDHSRVSPRPVASRWPPPRAVSLRAGEPEPESIDASAQVAPFDPLGGVELLAGRWKSRKPRLPIFGESIFREEPPPPDARVSGATSGDQSALTSPPPVAANALTPTPRPAPTLQGLESAATSEPVVATPSAPSPTPRQRVARRVAATSPPYSPPAEFRGQRAAPVARSYWAYAVEQESTRTAIPTSTPGTGLGERAVPSAIGAQTAAPTSATATRTPTATATRTPTQVLSGTTAVASPTVTPVPS